MSKLRRQRTLGERVSVRDTTDRDGVTLKFTPKPWQQFTLRLRG
jgi:hypothetical protein